LIIATSVLRELDGLKKNINPETAAAARKAAVYISNNLDNLTWFYECENEDWQKIPVDDQLLKITEKVNGILLTNDVYLKVKAIIHGISTKGYSIKENYTGIEYLILEFDENGYNEILDNILQTGEKPEDIELFENQYLIVKNKNSVIKDKYGIEDYEVMATFVYRNKKLHYVDNLKIKNQWINCIVPRNTEQMCLFEALNNKEISIICAGGKQGRGKSFILNNYALQELEKENIQKIVYVPNNSYTEDSMDIGALPGEALDKLAPMFGTLTDLIGIDYVSKLIQDEKLEICPIGYMRGRSFNNSIIIVNEAQNLTESHIKLLIARCGEGTRIFFDGSLYQIDKKTFKNKNGLKSLFKLRLSKLYSKIFAAVNLVKTERSFTAQAAEWLEDSEIL
jgi:predicted ribonuclease YlaK